MIKIFDLDDTLYPEYTFVLGGFKAVSKFLGDLYCLDSKIVFDDLNEILNTYGRGEVFNIYLKRKQLFSCKLVKKLVSVYRYHNPQLSLHEDALHYLNSRKSENLYLVTDGNKLVQSNKIIALQLSKFFKGIYITHRYGIKYSKPSPYCFELIKRREGCEWNDLVYFGDNPKKDFITLNQLGANTVRLLRGNHIYDQAKPGYDARLSVISFNDCSYF